MRSVQFAGLIGKGGLSPSRLCPAHYVKLMIPAEKFKTEMIQG